MHADSHPGDFWTTLVGLLREIAKIPEEQLGAVAQLVAHLHGMQGVRGSSPLSSTK